MSHISPQRPVQSSLSCWDQRERPILAPLRRMEEEPGSLWVPEPAVKWFRNRKTTFPSALRCSPQHTEASSGNREQVAVPAAMGCWTDSRLHQGLCCHPGTTHWERALNLHGDSQTSHCPTPQIRRHQVNDRSHSANHS